MQYEQRSEKAPMAPMQMAQGQDLKQNGDIRRARTTVFVLLGIQLILALAYFVMKVVNLIQYYRISPEYRVDRVGGTYVGSVIGGAISILYLIIFIIVVAKYLRIGILIFAWLGLLELICILIILILSIVAILGLSIAAKAAGSGIILSIVVIVFAGIACILTILTVIFSFKLAKLIKQHRAYQYV